TLFRPGGFSKYEAAAAERAAHLHVEVAQAVRAVEVDRAVAQVEVRVERRHRRPGNPEPHGAEEAPDQVRARPEAADVGAEVEREQVDQRRRPTDPDQRIGPREALVDVGAELFPVDHPAGRVELFPKYM